MSNLIGAASDNRMDVDRLGTAEEIHNAEDEGLDQRSRADTESYKYDSISSSGDEGIQNNELASSMGVRPSTPTQSKHSLASAANSPTHKRRKVDLESSEDEDT